MTNSNGERSQLDFDTLSLPCPALTDSHHAWRSEARDFVDTQIAPHIDEWEMWDACPKLRAWLLNLHWLPAMQGYKLISTFTKNT